MSFIDDLQTFKSQFSGKPQQDIQGTQVPAFIDDLENYSKKQLPSVSGALEPLLDMVSPKTQPEIKPQEIINQELQPTEPMPSGQMTEGMPAITQKFGNRSAVEVFSGGFNRGTDFGVGENTQISVPQGDWEVIETFDQATKRGRIGDKTNRGYGNSVLVRNKQTGETLRFSHLNRVGVKPGQTVKGGTIVGLSGATGNVTGAHVDVEYTNPKGQLTAVERSPYARDIFGGRGGGNPILDELLEMGKNKDYEGFKKKYMPDELYSADAIAGMVNPIQMAARRTAFLKAGQLINSNNINKRMAALDALRKEAMEQLTPDELVKIKDITKETVQNKILKRLDNQIKGVEDDIKNLNIPNLLRK